MRQRTTSPSKKAKGKAAKDAAKAKEPPERVIQLDKDGNVVSGSFFSRGEMAFHGVLLCFLLGFGWHFSRHPPDVAAMRRATAKAPRTILGAFANRTMDWLSSTTPAPISVASTLAKAALRGDGGVKPPASLSVDMAPYRAQVMADVHAAIKASCETPGSKTCKIDATDSDFDMTPLHYAQLYGHAETVELLLSLGANPEAIDNAGRKPANLTFANFVSNSRKWAKEGKRACEVPEVHLTLPADGDLAPVARALHEVRRLIHEGEPVMVRNVSGWLKLAFPRFEPEYPDGAAFVRDWGNQNVTVSGVPYARKFNLPEKQTTLLEYDSAMRKHEGRAAPGSSAAAKMAAVDADPPYVFQQDSEACKEGYYMMDAFGSVGFPTAGDKPLICPPSSAGLQLASMHYFLGPARSGAPLHVHSDAANLIMKGSKRWWVVPPGKATFSSKHIHRWLVEDLPKIPAAERPLECVQNAGDLMYVPFDWGHGAINLEDGTFGYTMELVNRRDTLMSVMGWKC